MFFKEWCTKELGISTVIEGKITPIIVIPTLGGQVHTDALAQFYGGYYVNTPVSGIAFTKESYTRLCQYLDQEFSRTVLTHPKTDLMFQQNRNQYFSKLGVNSAAQLNDRQLPNIHFTFQTTQAKQEFMKKFASYYPRDSFDALNNVPTVEMPPWFLSHLREMYYNQQNTNIYNRSDTITIREQLDNLERLKTHIQQHALDKRLDKAQKLSLDYNNSSSVNNTEYEASSAYALSLQVFAEINKDNLTPQEYNGLIYASSILAAYDDKGHLKQSLKTDSNFTNYLTRRIYFPLILSGKISNQGWPLISNLPPHTSSKILNLINDNTTNILHGHPKVSLGKNKYFTMQRFIPDASGYSETDEIVCQAGGMFHHSAMFRVIKVGVLQNGQQVSDPAQIPHHYEYYKVESNLGAGCHDPNFSTKTCTGTYITKLEPFVLDSSNQLVPSTTNPFINPQQYQAEMEFTLRELLSAERQLLFYRQPRIGQNGESSSIPGTLEANEWTRLNAIKNLLSGKYHPHPLSYFSKDRVDPSKIYALTVKNQSGYLQEEGSCTIFSIKHLVHGIIGPELATIHSEFIQRNNGAEHLAAIDRKINALKLALQPVQISVDSTHTQLWIDTFKRSMNITGSGPIQGLDITSSSKKGDDLLVIHDHALKKLWYELLQKQRTQFPLDPYNAKQQISSFAHYFPNGLIPDYQLSTGMITFSDPVIAYLWEEHSKKPVLLSTPGPLSLFSHNTKGAQMIQKLPLAEAAKMQSAIIAPDIKNTNQYVIKLKFPDKQSALLFANSVETLTTDKPPITVNVNNEVILGEKRCTVLFQKLNIDLNKILRELPQETTIGTTFNFG